MFDRVNINEIDLESCQAHGGLGDILFARLLTSEEVQGPCNFVDVAVLPPGASIGYHRHASNEEEFYLVLSGSGEITRNGEKSRVVAGDLIRNSRGGSHGLVNDGSEPLKIFVFELATLDEK